MYKECDGSDVPMTEALRMLRDENSKGGHNDKVCPRDGVTMERCPAVLNDKRSSLPSHHAAHYVCPKCEAEDIERMREKGFIEFDGPRSPWRQ